MKKLLLSGICAALGLTAFARDGYKIEVKFKQDVTDSFVYLAHYYAKALPTIYKTDSGRVINKRTAIIESKDSVLGGIYLLLFDNRTKFTEFILNNGDAMTINVDTTDMPANITFKGSEENTRYVAYEKFLMGYGKKQQALIEELKSAKSAADTQKVRDRSGVLSKELTAYRKDYAAKYPGTYISTVFKALAVPEVPEGTHYLAGTKTVDTEFAYHYYKQHYWDQFDFKDDRLIYSPVYDAKLDEYFNRMVMPLPDSMNREADVMLARTRKSKELFKYTLHWLAGNAERSKVMGMDEAFVHLVENYYMKGDAYWLDSASLAKYEDRAKKIAPNVLGNTAPELLMQDIWSLQDKPLSQQEGKYTLLVFWSRECGHCMKEIPQLDSVYRKVLKAKGVKIYAVSTEGDLTDIQKTVEQLKLQEWANVVDARNKTDYRSKYDVYSTPKMYLLDDKKKILGKGLDHSNIAEVIEFTEKKKAKKT
ncbi:TlpA family protein disulfide reductase [Taibaiella helva]|uniref:TlpA family protein disulfide reductase n=1 Tax=Taibaiella helva TaxID=2301235 RepID=UPI000E593113|nr:TlpA family protein disulfide reductase [Taibaiella helva]